MGVDQAGHYRFAGNVDLLGVGEIDRVARDCFYAIAFHEDVEARLQRGVSIENDIAVFEEKARHRFVPVKRAHLQPLAGRLMSDNQPMAATERASLQPLSPLKAMSIGSEKQAHAAGLCRATPFIIAAPFSAIMIVGALVLVPRRQRSTGCRSACFRREKSRCPTSPANGFIDLDHFGKA
jgi:hypothetical protein